MIQNSESWGEIHIALAAASCKVEAMLSELDCRKLYDWRVKNQLGQALHFIGVARDKMEALEKTTGILLRFKQRCVEQSSK